MAVTSNTIGGAGRTFKSAVSRTKTPRSGGLQASKGGLLSKTAPRTKNPTSGFRPTVTKTPRPGGPYAGNLTQAPPRGSFQPTVTQPPSGPAKGAAGDMQAYSGVRPSLRATPPNLGGFILPKQPGIAVGEPYSNRFGPLPGKYPTGGGVTAPGGVGPRPLPPSYRPGTYKPGTLPGRPGIPAWAPGTIPGKGSQWSPGMLPGRPNMGIPGGPGGVEGRPSGPDFTYPNKPYRPGMPGGGWSNPFIPNPGVANRFRQVAANRLSRGGGFTPYVTGRNRNPLQEAALRRLV